MLIKLLENDEEMHSCEFFLFSSALEFEDLSLNTQGVDLNLEFFRRANFDSNEYWNDELNVEHEEKLEVSELGKMPLVSEVRLKCVDSGEVSSSWLFAIWEEKEIAGE